MRFLTIFLILLGTVQVSGQSTVESIPNQKLINGSYVSDPDSILDESTIVQIDTLLRSLEKETTAQVAIVIVKSIGEEDVFEFAQNLFDAWGIGKKATDNGLLILMVDDQRTIRFHTGEGLEGVLPDVICKRIQEDHMVPEFKNGNYDAGMLAGLQQVKKILTDPNYAEELKEPEPGETSDWIGFVTFLIFFFFPPLVLIYIIKAANGRFSNSRTPEFTQYPALRVTRGTWLLEFVAIPVLIISLFGFSSVEDPAVWCTLSLYFYFLLTAFHRLRRSKKIINGFLKAQEYHEIVDFLRSQQWHWLLMAIVFPLPFVFYFVYHLISKRTYRNHPRNCKECDAPLNKLNDRDEDVYLSPEQLMEEKLRSIDYDVWKCSSCESVEHWFYLNRHTKYKHCPKCKTMAFYSSSRRTVKSATYLSSGSGEEVHMCKFCGHQKKSTYSIAQLTRSTSSSSSGSSGSSSSGGSWGGGSSGGGGASSRW